MATSYETDMEKTPSNISLVSFFSNEAHLVRFVGKLYDSGIHTTADLENYTLDEIFEIAPTSEGNRERFLEFEKKGFISLKHE